MRLSVFNNRVKVGGIDAAGFFLPGDSKFADAVHADFPVPPDRRQIPRRRIRGPFLSAGKNPFPVIQPHLRSLCFPFLAGIHRIAPNGSQSIRTAVSRNGKPVPDPQPDEYWRGTDLPHPAVFNQDVMHVRGVTGFQTDPPGTDKFHSSHGDMIAPAAGLRAEFHPSAGLAAIRGGQLVPGILSGINAACVKAHDLAVFHQNVPHRHELLRPEGSLQADGVVVQGIENGIPQRNVQRVPRRIHQQTIHPDIPAAAQNQRKMSADQKGKVRQHDAFAAVQRNALIAEPAAVMPLLRSFCRESRIPPVQDVFQRFAFLAGMIIASVQHSAARNRDPVQFSAIDETVGQIAVPVILNAREEVHFRFVIVAPLDARPGGAKHSAFFQMQRHIALHPKGVYPVDAFRNQNGASPASGSPGDQVVDHLCVFHGAGGCSDPIVCHAKDPFPMIRQMLRPDSRSLVCCHVIFSQSVQILKLHSPSPSHYFAKAQISLLTRTFFLFYQYRVR